ncbi:MAG: RNA methyltransferase [Saprospiraceae bacterium]|nr:RNA methyltransferase [Saprospiraceae bacterium]
MTKVIASVQNPLIKNIVVLREKARERRIQGLFVAEGLRETAMALRAGYRPEALLYDPAHTDEGDVAAFGALAPDALVSVSSPVFEKIAYRAGAPNVVAVFHMRALPLENIALSDAPLILVLESVEKPGNLGAVLRTADAAGADAVILCDPLTDWYNPNVIRASLGAVFTVPVAAADSVAVVDWLRKNDLRILSTYLEAARSCYDTDLTRGLGLVMGAEATGISRFWIEAADEHIIIPMQGRVDSLNVSASAAVLLFEARRQRKFAV